MALSSQRWDIFCRVVDNFGDAAVCWRLARQLAQEYGLQTRLWIDDLSVLQQLHPEINPAIEIQHTSGVEVRFWPIQFPDVIPANVVIEAFACTLPSHYVEAMVAIKPLWINLEYLTAEGWIAESHGLPSPHPTLPLTKYFFFPGFRPNTGGLLREKDLGKGFDTQQFWKSLSLPVPPESTLKVSLFGYENPAMASLLDAWTRHAAPVFCLVPEGRLLPQVSDYFQRSLQAGDVAHSGSLEIKVLPFLKQDNYDELLWNCDLNFVRGEDSFVRAQWAGKPLVWQIYKQDEDVHLQKLYAFQDIYCVGLPLECARALRDFWRCWNTGQTVNWENFTHHLADIETHARGWQSQLAGQQNLAYKLVNFHKKHI